MSFIMHLADFPLHFLISLSFFREGKPRLKPESICISTTNNLQSVNDGGRVENDYPGMLFVVRAGCGQSSSGRHAS